MKTAEIEVDWKSVETTGNVAPVKVDLEDTFRHMTWRKLCRLRHGHARKQSTSRLMWVILVVILFLGMAGVLATRRISNIPVQILVSMLVLVISYIIVKISLALRWFLFWIVAAVIAMVFYTNLDQIPAQEYRPETTIVLIALACLELITLIGYVFWWYVYPRIALHRLVDPVFWWHIQPVSSSAPAHNAFVSSSFCTMESYSSASTTAHELNNGENSNCLHLYSYRCFDTGWLRSTRYFSYAGQVHPETGKPHGFGRWTDNSVAGEHLTGFWKNGIPVGPFRSNEYATGFAFANIRVGYCRATSDYWSDWSYIPSRPLDGKVSYGVAGVECSLAGKFFLDLPRSQIVKDRVESLSEVLDIMNVKLPIEYTDIPQVTIALEGGNLVVAGSRNTETPPSSRQAVATNINEEDISLDNNTDNILPLERLTLQRIPGCNQIQIISQDATGTAQLNKPVEGEKMKHEALIFIPGFNCPLEIASGRLAQMLALNSFPPDIQCFVFNWPCAKIITYFSASRIAADKEVLQDLADFIRDLHMTGRISRFHILTHSMGARLALNASYLFADLFQDVGCTDLSDPRPKLSTFTLFNPEADLDMFTSDHYARVYEVCDCLSLFVDESDGALKWAELFTRQRMLGLYATQSLRKYTRRNNRLTLNESASSPNQAPVLSRPDGNEEITPSSNQATRFTVRTASSSSISYNNNNNDPNNNSNGDGCNTGNNNTRKHRLRLGKPDMTFIGFDLDVMDMTHIDANVHALRHCYFNINRLVLDDLRDIIVFRKRAKYRTNRLMRVDSNVYTYISAPSYIVNP